MGGIKVYGIGGILLGMLILALSGCGGGGANGGGANGGGGAVSYTVGGTLNGLAKNSTVTLTNNGSDTVTLSTNGAFTFPTALPNGAAYNVSVVQNGSSTQPCTSTYNAGTIQGASVTSLNVICGSWPRLGALTVSSGNLVMWRSLHTATLLPNGKVLVVGGEQSVYPISVTGFNPTALSSAELYDPSTGTWAATGSLNVARFGHTATLLPNGKVLVTGGNQNGLSAFNANFLSSAELYDPATGTWAVTGSLGTARVFHAATLLPSGKVLVAGGENASAFVAPPSFISSAELYDPTTGMWSATGSLASGRVFHTASLLPSGNVLVAAGEGTLSSTSTGPLSSAELYNPSTGIWTPTGSLNTARYFHTATLLSNGQLLIAGGNATSTGFASAAELYNPASGMWTITGSLVTPTALHAATLLQDGTVIVTGGTNIYGQPIPTDQIYNPVTGVWTSAVSLLAARETHTATSLPNGNVLLAGGNTAPSTELYEPKVPGVWSGTGSPSTQHRGAPATKMFNGNVLLAGGATGGYPPTSSAESYNPATGAWTLTASLNQGRYMHTQTLLPSGKILAAGGSNAYAVSCGLGCTGYYGGSLASAEIYDSATSTWLYTGSLTVQRDSHTATLLPNGHVLAAGGNNSNAGNIALASAELYDPAKGIWTLTGALVYARSGHRAVLLPNGTVLVVGGSNSAGPVTAAEVYDPSVGSWTVTGSLLTAGATVVGATLLPSGKVLATETVTPTTGMPTYSAELYDPATGNWTLTASPNQSEPIDQPVLLPSGKVLASPNQLYDPATNFWSLTGGGILPSNPVAGPFVLLNDGTVLSVGTVTSTANTTNYLYW